MLTKAELSAKRELEAEVGAARLRRLLVQPRCATAIDAFVAATQELVTGEVRIQLGSGVGDRQRPAVAERAVRRDARVVRAGETFPHESAEGFIRCSLETQLAAARQHAGRDAA